MWVSVQQAQEIAGYFNQPTFSCETQCRWLNQTHVPDSCACCLPLPDTGSPLYVGCKPMQQTTQQQALRNRHWPAGCRHSCCTHSYSLLSAATAARMSTHAAAAAAVAERTTMPMSVLAFMSTVWSSTMFMNWSKPRSVPVTCLLAFRVTAKEQQPHEQGQA